MADKEIIATPDNREEPPGGPVPGNVNCDEPVAPVEEDEIEGEPV